MRLLYFLLFLSVFIISYSQDEFRISSSECYANNDEDIILGTFQVDDTTYLSVIKTNSRYGYFASGQDIATWLVRLNGEFKVQQKVLVNYNVMDELGIMYDPITRAICFLNYQPNSSNFLDSITVYRAADLSIHNSIPVYGEVAGMNFSGTNRKFFDCENGGFLIKYTICYCPGYDSSRIIVIDSTLQLWADISYSDKVFDPDYNLLVGIDTSQVDVRNWIADIYFDNRYLYGASYVHDHANAPLGRTAMILHRFDDQFQELNVRMIDYTDGAGDFQAAYKDQGKFIRIRDNLAYFQDLGGYVAAIYAMDSSFQLFNKVIPTDTSGGGQRYMYGMRTWDDKLVVPTWFGDGWVTGSSDLYFYDEHLQLLRKLPLDSVLGLYFSIIPSVRTVYPLKNSGLILLVWGTASEQNGYHYVKINEDLNIEWVCPIPDHRSWKGKALRSSFNFTSWVGFDYDPIPQFEEIAGKQRTMTRYELYLDQIYGSGKDTTVIAGYKINLDDGRIMDTTIVTSYFTAAANKFVYFIAVRRSAEDEYALYGMTNQICSGRGRDVFSALSTRKYNTIFAKVYFDMNGNSLQDIGEPQVTDIPVTVTKNGNTTESYFDDDGWFSINVDTGTFSIKADHIPDYFQPVPDSVIRAYANFGHTDTVIFALQPKASVSDLDVSLTPGAFSRPGFPGAYILHVSNKGTTVQDARVQLLLSDKLDSITTFPPATLSGDTLIWTLPGFFPYSENTLVAGFRYKAPPETNAGDTLLSSAWISPVVSDITPLDNRSVLEDVLTGSYDPNDKLCNVSRINSEDISLGKYITYTIRFENTGNDTAFKIVIIDTLDTGLDPASIQPLQGLNTYTLTIKNNVLTFILDPIRLPAGATGAVSYKVKPNSSGWNGSAIRNRASILFDYNLPVVTEYATTTVDILSALDPGTKNPLLFDVFPNPSSGTFTVDMSRFPPGKKVICLVNLQGKVIWTRNLETERFYQANFRNLSAGTYLITVESEGMKEAKMINIISLD